MGLMSAGGGLTNSKLALATAEPSDVEAGKTFYSGTKVLKTGTRSESRTSASNDAQGQNKAFTYTYALGKGTYIFVFVGAIQKDNAAQWSSITASYSNGSIQSVETSRPSNTFVCRVSGIVKSNGSGTLTIRYTGGDSTRNTACAGAVFKIHD